MIRFQDFLVEFVMDKQKTISGGTVPPEPPDHGDGGPPRRPNHDREYAKVLKKHGWEHSAGTRAAQGAGKRPEPGITHIIPSEKRWVHRHYPQHVITTGYHHHDEYNGSHWNHYENKAGTPHSTPDFKWHHHGGGNASDPFPKSYNSHPTHLDKHLREFHKKNPKSKEKHRIIDLPHPGHHSTKESRRERIEQRRADKKKARVRPDLPDHRNLYHMILKHHGWSNHPSVVNSYSHPKHPNHEILTDHTKNGSYISHYQSDNENEGGGKSFYHGSHISKSSKERKNANPINLLKHLKRFHRRHG